MSEPFVTTNDVINFISDDMIYLGKLLRTYHNEEPNHLKAAHLARLVTVFGYGTLEGYRDAITREEGFHSRKLEWQDFFKHAEFRPHLERAVLFSPTHIHTIDEAITLVYGIKQLRNFIAHGLVDESADNFAKQMKHLLKAKMDIRPTKLDIEDANYIYELHEELIQIFGVARAHRTASKSC